MLLAAAALACHRLAAHDLFWQLRAGEWILAHGWPQTDPFSYAFPGREWIELRWLFCVAIWKVFAQAGPNALVLVRELLVLGTFAVLLSAPVGAGRRWAAAAGSTAALLLAATRLDLRPELVTFLALATTLGLLERWRRQPRRRWLAPLPLLQVVWTNAHTLAALGPVVQGLYLAGELLERRRAGGVRRPSADLAVTLGASCLALLVNPWGLRGALFPLQLFSEIRSGHSFGALIDEFRSPFAVAGFAFFFVAWIAVAALAGASLLLPRRLPVGRALVWGAFLYLACLSQRNVALFGIVAGSVLALDLAEAEPAGAWRRRLPALAAGVVAAAVLVLVPLAVSDVFFLATDTAKRFGTGLAIDRFPIRALAFVRAEGLPTPVLHGLGSGGYVLFEGGEKSAYVDGRLEVYGSEPIVRAARMSSSGAGFHEEAVRLNVWTAVVEHARAQDWIAALERRPEWVPVYFDAGYAVYLRIGEKTAELARRLRIDWASARPPAVEVPAPLAARDLFAAWPRRGDPRPERSRGELFLRVGQIRRGVERLRRAHASAPDDAETRLHLGFALRALGEETEAARLLDGLPRRLLGKPEIPRLEGSLLELAGRTADAAAVYRRAAIGAADAELLRALARAELVAGDPAAALSALDRLVRLAPGDVDAWNDRGLLLLRAGRREEALGSFAESVRRRPEQPRVWNQIGVVEVERGDLAAARRAFTRALEIDPEYATAAANLARLGSPPAQ